MQKNLKSKVLLTLLAASVFYMPAYANAAELTIDANTTEEAIKDWVQYDTMIYPTSPSGNTITINGNPGFLNNYNSFMGAYVYSDFDTTTGDITATLEKNTVSVNNTTFTNTPYFYGAEADLYAFDAGSTAKLNENTVTISSSKFEDGAVILGAYANPYSVEAGRSAELTKNSVNITNNSEFTGGTYIYGAEANLFVERSDEELPPAAAQATANLTGNFAAIASSTFNGDANINGANANMQDADNSKAAFTDNYVDITGSTFSSATINGANADFSASNSSNVSLTDNYVAITNNSTFDSATIYGAFANMPQVSDSEAAFTGNYVDISGSTFSRANINGAFANMQYADNSKAAFTGNFVNINNSTFNNATIYGAYADFSASPNSVITFDNNTVNIINSEFSSSASIYGAYIPLNAADYSIANFNNNTVTISGGKFNGASSSNIYGTNVTMTCPNTTANVNNGAVTISGGEFNYQRISGTNSQVRGDRSTVNFNNNSVTISDGEFSGTRLAKPPVISGTFAEMTGADESTAEFIKNTVTINGGKFSSATATDNPVISGAYAEFSNQNCIVNLDSNDVTINNGEFNGITIQGAYAWFPGTKGNAVNLDNNTVTINSGEFNGTTSIYGAHAYLPGADGKEVYFENNAVTIGGGEFNDTTNIYAVYAEGAADTTNATITNNTLTITESAGDLSNASLYGSNLAITNTTGNNLIVDGWNGNVASLNNFNGIQFKNLVNSDETVLNLGTDTNLTGVDVTVNTFAAGQTFAAGDKITLIDAADPGSFADEKAFTAQAGVAQQVSGTIKQDADNNVILTVESKSLTEQTDAVTETRAATAAFLNQSTDLISDSLDVLGRDGSYGVKTFAAVQGNRSTYDVADDLKINGWSVIAGFGAENEHNGGDFAWGVFYENGSGNYRTYNTFNNEFFRGDGSMIYNGGGIAARYENAKGVYTEGSLRAGMLKNEMDNALHDGAGNSYGYDTESTYYGAHIGVGQIFELDENTDLDVYGKFLHTFTDGDSVTIGGDTFDFDNVTSDRLRVGARVNKQQAKVNTYYGLAYEYEFNGDVGMTVQGIRADQQSFEGGSGIAELGFNYQPGVESPWNFDLNMRGYIGERQGTSFNVQATYTF